MLRLASLHYVIRIFIGTLVIEFLTKDINSLTPLWAIISLIVVIDPQVKTAWTMFRARFINTLIGCATGLLFLSFGTHGGFLTVGISISAFFSSYLTRMQQGWRIGPVTTALIMSAGITEKSAHAAFQLALERTAAILLGSVVALLVTIALSRVWMPPAEDKPEDKKSE